MAPLTVPADRYYWRSRAACRGVAQEMVPDDDALAVQLAKKICADCPVVSWCYADAEKSAEPADGVRGGLTLQERNTLVGLDRVPVPCPQCELICVPVSYATERCQVCDPNTPLTYADYRPRIQKMIAAGKTYLQVAEALRLSNSAVKHACVRWGMRAKTASKRGRRPLKECGTLAAKTRHSRHGESWKNCACRHVPWQKG